MKWWIFQGNPKKFDVDAYLKRVQANRGVARPLVRPALFAPAIHPGDKALLWRSDGSVAGSRGIVALGTILSAPELMEDDPDSRGLWKDADLAGPDLRTDIRLEDVRLTEADGMLLRQMLQGDLRTSELWILKWRSQTTYPVQEE